MAFNLKISIFNLQWLKELKYIYSNVTKIIIATYFLNHISIWWSNKSQHYCCIEFMVISHQAIHWSTFLVILGLSELKCEPGMFTAGAFNTLRLRKIVVIFQKTFSNTFSGMKVYEFWFQLHWSLFIGDPINNIPTLVQIMAWRRPGDKPLFEPITVSLLTHICHSASMGKQCGSIWNHEPMATMDQVLTYSCIGTCHWLNQCWFYILYNLSPPKHISLKYNLKLKPFQRMHFKMSAVDSW